ncbi:hypothetical protein RFI_38760 [Reticulomyxa filosa]|uniref:Uncharacterized protein n=1 Tax=Reticulomyxa filosa TaxID=46433 RepID=X6L9K0_RETFI|nr:hypothetical protein RFI_38760 [Reticulomyxa filosa]|eukprot:ETN98727.1 hypothetical protein RFI_38760 [Reticulomyxa filosa]
MKVYLFGEECLQKYLNLWDVETSKSLQVFNGHKDDVWCVDISPLESNNNSDNNNKMNNIGVIGGNGYTICSGSFDNTIRIWDIETTKQFNIFKGHEHWIISVKGNLLLLVHSKRIKYFKQLSISLVYCYRKHKVIEKRMYDQIHVD